MWIVFGAKESSTDFLVSFLEPLGSFLLYYSAIGTFFCIFLALWCGFVGLMGDLQLVMAIRGSMFLNYDKFKTWRLKDHKTSS